YGGPFGGGRLLRGRLAAQGSDLGGGNERRGFVHFAHGGIVDLLFGVRDDRQFERRYLRRGGWSRWLVPNGNQRESDFALGVQAEKSVDLRVHESGDDFGG